MKRILIFSSLSLLFPITGIAGNCTGGLPGNWYLGSAVSGYMVCASSATNSDSWQEYHNPNGTLTEYAKGPGDPVDPSHNVGSWQTIVQGPPPYNSMRTGRYTYGGNTYTYDVYSNLDSPVTNREIVFCESGASTTLVAHGTRPNTGGLHACP